MKKTMIVTLLLSGGLLAGCTHTEVEKAVPSVSLPALDKEAMHEIFGGFHPDQSRQAIRQIAQGYVTSQIPGATVEGMATTQLTANLYVVGVDVSVKREQRTIELVARRFYSPDGTRSYWKVEPLTPELSAALAGLRRKAP